MTNKKQYILRPGEEGRPYDAYGEILEDGSESYYVVKKSLYFLPTSEDRIIECTTLQDAIVLRDVMNQEE